MEQDARSLTESETRRRATRIGVGFGVVVALLGAGPLLAAWFDPTGAMAPMWVIELACGAFIAAGLSFVFESLGRRVLARFFSFSILPMLGLTAVWALFLDDQGTCSIGSGLFGVGISGDAPGSVCRTAFLAAGTVIVLAACALTGIAWLRRRAARERINRTG